MPELSYKILERLQGVGRAQQTYLKAIGLASVEGGMADIELILKLQLAYCELIVLP